MNNFKENKLATVERERYSILSEQLYNLQIQTAEIRYKQSKYAFDMDLINAKQTQVTKLPWKEQEELGKSLGDHINDKSKLEKIVLGNYSDYFTNCDNYYSMMKRMKFIEKELSQIESNIYQHTCLLYTSPSPRDLSTSRMPSSA